MKLSVTAGFAVIAYISGLIQYIVAFSTNEWVGLETYKFVSLWRMCLYERELKRWVCEPVVDVDYVQVAQAFAVIAMMCYVMCSILMVPYVMCSRLQLSKPILIAHIFLIFISGCMTVMTCLVMGIKGHDVFCVYKNSELLPFDYTVGWSYVIAVTSSIFTFISFAMFMCELIRVHSDEQRMTPLHLPMKPP